MAHLFIGNAFSLNMLAVGQFGATLRVLPIGDPVAYVRNVEDYVVGQNNVTSIVGHADTATVFESELNYPVPMNRVTFEMRKGDVLMVGQYSGPRLPEGAKELPEGASIKWFEVTIV